MHSRVVALFFVGLIGLELSACASGGGGRVASDSDAQTPQQLLLDRLLLSEKAERPRLWQEVQAAPERYPLSHVLLQSLPGHAGHAPGRARQVMLDMLNSDTLKLADARLLRLRLLDLRQEMFLENALAERNQRLQNLIRIEQDLQHSGTP